MQDHQLYQRILGIEGPWQVERVELQLKEGEVHVYLTHQDNREWACAECGVLCPLYDHQPERQWRHLDTCQYRTILHAKPPRSQCPEHGVRVVKLSWAEASSRFTVSFRQGCMNFADAVGIVGRPLDRGRRTADENDIRSCQPTGTSATPLQALA